MEFHRSAFKHGYDEQAILHALDRSVTVVDLEPTADPPKMLAIGPDHASNMVEVIWLQLDGTDLVIHAMALRPTFHGLLPKGDDLT